ncbi:type VI secretion system tip protein VgrG, partial [Erwinia amylovora]
KSTDKRNMLANVGMDATSNTGANHTINVGGEQAVLTMDKQGNALREATASIRLKVKNNYIRITPSASEMQVAEGDRMAESEKGALFKGKDITLRGGGTNAELSANDAVSIT